MLINTANTITAVSVPFLSYLDSLQEPSNHLSEVLRGQLSILSGGPINDDIKWFFGLHPCFKIFFN